MMTRSATFRRALAALAVLLLAAAPARAQFVDGVRAETGVDRVNAQLGLSGSGAIVAVLDRGLDYEHPAFRNPDGTTRLLYLFDTLDNTGAHDADNPTGFGTVYTRAEINAALAAGTRLNTRDAVGHGTVSMGIAAGRGVDGTEQYVGMAPGADLIAVKLITDGAPAHDGEPAEAQVASYGTRLFPAIDFVIAAAEAAGKPVVMLANFGSIQGPMDGTSTDARGIDQRFGSGHPGRVFITGSSDDGGVANHAGGTVAQGETAEVKLRKGYGGALRLDLWYPDTDRFTVEIVAPNGTVYGPYAPPTNTRQTSAAPSGGGFTYYHNGSAVDFFGATSATREILIDFNSATTGVYTLRLTGTTVANGRFDAALNPSNIFSAPNNGFETYVDAGHTVWDLASARGNLPMNSYVLKPTWTDVDGNTHTYPGNSVGTGRLWPGSGVGPTYDGRLGIAVSAPGQANIGAYAPRSYFASFRQNLVVDGPAPYGVLGFVSGAAPVVTGIAALLLDADPTLDAAGLRDALEQTARADAFTGAVPNPQWGYGKVDAFAAAQRVLAGTPAEAGPEGARVSLAASPNPARGAATVTLTLDAPQRATVGVFDVLGRRVALLHDGPLGAGTHALRLDAARLPAGVYVVRASVSAESLTRTVTVVR